MTKGVNKKIIMIVMIMSLFSVASCKKDASDSEADSTEYSENSVVIYYVDGMEIVPRGETYQLKQPDILASSVEEIITAMTEELKAEGLEISSFMLDAEDKLHLVMVKPSDISKEQMLMLKASVCNTLFQLQKLDIIYLTINEADGSVYSDEEFDENSFYIYNER